MTTGETQLVGQLSWDRQPHGKRPGAVRYTMVYGPYRAVIDPEARMARQVRLRLFKSDADGELLLVERAYGTDVSAKSAARRLIIRDMQGGLLVKAPGPATVLEVRPFESTADSTWRPVEGAEGARERVFLFDEGAGEGQVRRVAALVSAIGPGDGLATVAEEGSWRYEIRVDFVLDRRGMSGLVLGGVRGSASAAQGAATRRAHQFLHYPDRRALQWVAETVGFEPTAG